MNVTRWKYACFADAFEDKTAAGNKIQQQFFKSIGRVPIIDQGAEFIAGYSDEDSLAWNAELPVVVFGDHTRTMKYVDFPFILGADGVKVLVPREGLSAKFAYYYLTSLKIPSRGYARHFRHLKEVAVPIPPSAEQQRLVALLDKGDELRKLRAEADHQTAALLPALFYYMFGQRIAVPPIVTSTVGLKAPREWRWLKLTEVARLATGHTPSRRHPEWWGGDIPWISLTDIRELDGKIATATGEYVNEEGIANSSSVKLPKGTVCFSRTASVGFVTIMGREMATSQDFVNWVCGPELDPIFLMGALMQAREYLRSLASGSTHKTIYFPTVEQFATIVPPLALQKEFAARVTEIRAMQDKQAASRTRLDDFFQSMLHRAFNGEL